MTNERSISADPHVTPPKDLWTSRAPARLRERAPRVESTPQGDFWIVDSQVSGAIGLDASAGHKPEEFRPAGMRSEEHTSELQSQSNLVCRLLLEKKKK